MDPRPIVLEGRVVRLVPLRLEHAADLFAAGADDDVWRYMPRATLRDVTVDLRAYPRLYDAWIAK